MFISVYFYRVPNKNIAAFLEVQKDSAEIYKRNGAIDDWTFGADNLNSKYGCSSFSKEIPLGIEEQLFFSMSLFNSKDDHDMVMASVDKDPEIEKLYEKVCGLIDLKRIIRGEFNRLV